MLLFLSTLLLLPLVFVSKHFRLFVTQTKTRRTVSKTKRTDKKKRQEKRKTMRRLSTGSKVRQDGWGRKNNINSSRNYELQLFSCLGHFSSSFLSRCDAQVLPTWLKAETAKHTRTHSFSLPVSFHFSSSHLAGPQKNKALQKSKKSWQTFKYLNVLSSGLSQKCYAATPTLSRLSLHDLTEIEFPVSCLLLFLLLPCAFAGTSKLKLPLCLTLFFARSTDIYSIYKNSGTERERERKGEVERGRWSEIDINRLLFNRFQFVVQLCLVIVAIAVVVVAARKSKSA